MTQTTDMPHVTFPLSQGEALVLNECFGVQSWTAGVQHQWTASDRKRITEAQEKEKAKCRWPGTRSFDHSAAYRVEMLERVASRIAV